MATAKITVVGAGFVGMTTAQRIVEKDLANVCLIDILEGMPQGKALDMMQTAPIEGYDAEIVGTNDYKDTANSDIIIITAGLPRKPGMSREDLIKKNADIVGAVTEQIVEFSPNGKIIVVSNPLDIMTYLAFKKSGWTKNRVVGMAGILDTARFSAFIAMELNVSMRNVHAMVLGGHGDSMVPITRYTTVSGISVEKFIPTERLAEIVQRTRMGGGEIVKLLKTGSAYYAPSAAAVSMAQSILWDEGRVLPCACWLEGEYGLNDVYIGVPCILNKNGVDKVVELDLTDSEREALNKSAAIVKENCDSLAV
ncbi:malate dehydrogenase [Planctomycetota bacterium]